ncbi:PREDICTED: uncharacterized protein LOC109475696 [Branchiostoma belcheri]|uniref:Uncharacterized protein LOC109475696 n=1 Tax=Branchiostoma belcheri TaxID=7741 RepID=A0A6P4ZQV2_BRABE|nr:PREDICTED: uncharacterized protein LOC109475696 [Branchiostoma belcheri]
MAAPVLNPNASLVGHNPIPLVKRIRDEPTPASELLARFVEDVPLENHNDEDLRGRIRALTGNDADDYLQMAGLDHKSHDAILRLCHFAIIAACETTQGQPIQAAKDAALEASRLLDDNPTPTPTTSKKDASAKRQPPNEQTPDQPGPSNPHKKAKRQSVPADSSESSDDEDLEDDLVRLELRHLKEVCLDPGIHLYPLKLQRALSSLCKAAKKTKHRRARAFQPLPTIPRQWTASPSVACPECHHPNDKNFRQCQMCAYQRKPFKHPQKTLLIDEVKIKERLDEVKNIATSSDYGRKKVAMEQELSDFLGNISPPKDLITASPKNVCAFLVWKDKGGKTVVHATDCKNFGNKRKTDCGCPRRLAAGTVDAMIGQLRAIFNNRGRGGEWNDTICTGNPAAAPMVKQYLKVVKEEQANAMVQPTQAQPVFFNKLERVCRHIANKMKDPAVKEAAWFTLARDQAFFKILFFAADRASDLGRCKAEELAWLPGEKGIRFNHTFGKTLRDGSANAFPILAGKSNATCPVQGLRVYMRVAKALKIRLNKGYLFRTVDKSRRVLNEPFLYDAAQSRFKAYLCEMGEYEGETLHGVRTASAITMALGGADDSSLMTHDKSGTETWSQSQTQSRSELSPPYPSSSYVASGLQTVYGAFDSHSEDVGGIIPPFGTPPFATNPSTTTTPQVVTTPSVRTTPSAAASGPTMTTGTQGPRVSRTSIGRGFSVLTSTYRQVQGKSEDVKDFASKVRAVCDDVFNVPEMVGNSTVGMGKDLGKLDGAKVDAIVDFMAVIEGVDQVSKTFRKDVCHWINEKCKSVRHHSKKKD